ncbi:hypothetical protein, conserved [Trypanosoma brucei gambiense DAL972]|uniref:PIN domain-containing protein n=1 Tax=Trypanosoma brucei gambiense (strain MHOM/CI/86/DAL972) TaxID=679716 RepID=C9ZZG3_TRYB9|nr:hypothetical protein, conserved [Trypanosoma brucei gambiense DAL972]CBH14812.1 hypothetical protein, conserved [Trypanosoma brucei gambiense DAL972]|eukprot:XP_011777078.1 hypothetical protein, conserved [Trypanosoma brucei gambiense DAL972]
MDGRIKGLFRAACSDTMTPWEAALQVVYTLLGPSRSTCDVGLFHEAVSECMRVCLLHRKASEALRVHGLLNRCGHAMEWHPRKLRRPPSASAGLSPKSLQGLSSDELALLALRQQPHRVHQSMIVAEIIAAERGDCVGDVGIEAAVAQCSLDTSCGGDSVVRTWFPTKGGAAGIYSIAGLELTQLSEAEQFRIQFQQNIQLLRTTQRLGGQLGLYYLLSQMRRVVEDVRLASEVEIEPLIDLGRAVLNHPLVFTTPTSELARERLLFEDFGRFAGSEGLSSIQEKKLASLEALTESMRPLCKQPLKFMHCVTASWDALFIRRAAATLVLPGEAHDVLPRRYSMRARTDSRVGQRRSKEPEENRLGASRWTDPNDEVFGGTDIEGAAERVEFIIRRRLHHDIVVPDSCFVLQHFNRLLQLAKHREVVVPYSVLLDIAHSALEDQGSRRFHSRRVLLALMHNTTTKQTALESNRPLSPYSISMKEHCGGVTLLGLQDEVALLEESQERFFLAPDSARVEPSCSNPPLLSDAHYASVLVAKQLEKIVSVTNGRLTGESASVKGQGELDLLVSGVVEAMTEEKWGSNNSQSSSFLKHHSDHNERNICDGDGTGPPVLFKSSRLRSSRARTPVIVATTNGSTRRAAFMVGLPMYPSVSVV